MQGLLQALEGVVQTEESQKKDARGARMKEEELQRLRKEMPDRSAVEALRLARLQKKRRVFWILELHMR